MLEDKDRVINLIAEQVGILVFEDRIPDRKSLQEEKLQAIAGEFKVGMLTSHIVGEVIGDLAFEEVLKKVKRTDDPSGEKKMFSELSGVDAKAVTDEVLEILLSLPQDYVFIFKLPKSSISIRSISISFDTEILSLNDDNIKNFAEQAKPPKGFGDLLSSFGKNSYSLSVGDSILVIRRKGYIGKYGSIKIVNANEDPLYILKVVLGVYLALEIIKRKKDTDYLQPFLAYSYGVYGSDKELIRTLNESTEDADFLYRLEFNESKLELSDLARVLKETATDFDKSNIVLNNLFTPILFAGGKTEERIIKKQRMIKNAAYWLYEAFKTTQEHIKAIYLTTAFDSLVNAKGREDTKEYKASLVANIIANNALEADGIIERICKLYSLRNEIVHGEKAVSTLERYSDEVESAQSVVYDGLWYLVRFLSNRIGFISRGLSIVNNSKAGNN